jgi:xylulokinase
MSLILAIDLGTSGPKVALFTATGALVAGASEPVRLLLLPDGGVEQDPAEWWAAICTATRRLLHQSGVAAAEVAGVAVTAQWSGTVAVDAAGQPLMNAIIWMDARGAQPMRRVTGGLPSFAGYGVTRLWPWLRKTGGIPGLSGKDSIAHILFIKTARPELYDRTHKFLEPKDYLNLKLTGRFAATVESITLHWVTDNRDIHNVRYDEQLLGLVGVAREKLPDLVRAVDVLGPLTPAAAADLGLGEHVQVVGGAPDIHSAAVGSGAVDDFAAHCYIGTSGWLSCHVPFKKTDLLHNMAALPSAIPGRYLLINEHEVAGAALTFLRDSVFFADDALLPGSPPADFFTRLEAVAAAAAPGSGRVIFTPWLHGERSPVDDATLRGGWHNLSLRTTRGDLVRSVYEGVAYNTRWLLPHVEKFSGRPLENVRLVGGGGRSDLWCQIHADVLQRPVLQVADPLHTNTRGAAYLAAAGLGYMTLHDLGAQAPIKATYTPRRELAGLYDELFGAFAEIYRKNHGLYRRLNRAGVKG